MESATLRRPSRRALASVGPVPLLLTVAAVGWALTAERMGGMDAGPGTDLGSLGWFVVAWVTMMAAMMLPLITPTVLARAGIPARSRNRRRTPATGVTAAFIAGYLFSWAIAGLLGYMIVEGVRSLAVGFLAWENGGPYVAGGVLVGAALYQLTPLKDAYLRECRSPLMLGHGRPGRVGALRSGVEHGGVCVGCCCALMAALFALGVMSVGWMALIAALLSAERLLPWHRIATRGIATFFVVLGIAVALAPEGVPGLTIPGSPEAEQAMEAMGMDAAGGAMGGESMSHRAGGAGAAAGQE